MPSEQLDLVWTGADAWARARKATGDQRPLDELRVAALVTWAETQLTGSSPTTSTTDHDAQQAVDDDTQHADAQPAADDDAQRPADPTDPATGRTPTRHGRPLRLIAMWDLPSLLGLDERCGELLDSGATLPPGAMRELLARGVHLRRMLIDPDNGELLDLSDTTWSLPGQTGPVPPVELRVLVDLATWQALRDGMDDELATAVTAAPEQIRAMLAHPFTADDLDDHPAAEQPSAALAAFIAARHRHPANPCAGLSAAAAGDLDHIRPRSTGGPTTRDNLHPPTRRWHVAKTHGGWTVRRVGRVWTWTSPLGRTYTVEPHDYRLGP
jgi:hypothetical protein